MRGVAIARSGGNFLFMRTYCVFYRSFFDAISELPEPNQLELYRAIFELSLNENRIQLTGINKTIFTLIEPQIIANIQRFKNGSKEKIKPKGSETEAKPKQDKSETEANKNKNKNKNENKNEKKNFTPPTLAEVTQWFTEQGSTAEAGAKAWQYYTDGNWHDAKGSPVKSWRQKMRGGRWLETTAINPTAQRGDYENLNTQNTYSKHNELNNTLATEWHRARKIRFRRRFTRF